MTPAPRSAYLVLLVGIFAVAMAAIIIRLAQDEAVPSLLIAGGRLIIATAILTPMVWRSESYRQQIRSLSRRDAGFVVVSGLFLALHFATWVSSLEYTTVLISTVLVTTTPIWTGLLEVFFLRERPSRAVIVGLGIAMLGGIIIGLAGGDETSADPLLGALLSTVGAVMVAFYMVIGRKMRATLSLTPYIWMVYGVAAIALSGAMLLTGTPVTGHAVAGYGWVVALALIPQLIGHTSINYSLGYLPATYISVATQLEPVISAFVALFVFSEVPGVMHIVGGVVITSGVLFASLRPVSAARKASIDAKKKELAQAKS